VSRVVAGRVLADGVRAGLAGAVVGAAPSTVHALLTGRDLREATAAAGSIVLPREQRERRLLVLGAGVHVVVSVAWGVTFAAVLPRGHTARAGAVAGLTVAALDLGLIGRHMDRIAALPLLPQVLDHVVYGTTVGVVLRMQRRAVAGAGL
jgi:hypothetical protein